MRGEAIVSVQTPTRSWRARTGRRLMTMPKVLCFDENPVITLRTLADLRQLLDRPLRGMRQYNKPSKHRGARSRFLGSYIAFEEVERITPAAALAIAAEYERILLRSGSRSFVANAEKWDRTVFETMQEIGFFDIVGFAGSVQEPDMKADLLTLPMRSGDTADPTQIAELVEKLKQLYPNPDESSEAGLIHLYGAMVEAVGNVVNHAYPTNFLGSNSQRAVRRWWMTGAVDRRNRRTTAVVFDRGVTIPVSLPNWANAEGWLRRMSRRVGIISAIDDPRSDGDAIAAAVEEAVSSTGEQHRGTGLAQIRGFVDQCQEGRLRIMSRCGEVIFRPGQEPDVKTYDVPLGGTLVEWSVLL